jgi:hypothetical protein
LSLVGTTNLYNVEENMFSNRGSRFFALGITFVLLFAMTVTSVFAGDIAWSKNGTTNGKCNTLTYDASVPVGQQRWLFILTSPEATGPFKLTTLFNPPWQNPANPISGVKQANGSVHYVVYTTENATLVSATADKATAKSVLTVSHCEAHPPALRVSKTAATTFTRTYTWDIKKTVDVALHQLFNGTSGTSNYTVTVTKTGYVDSAWTVTGSITIYNPAVFAALIASVTDVVGGAGAATVNCGVGFPYSLAPGGTLNCTYNKALPDGTNRVNTATANTSNVVPGGSGTANVTFGNPTKVVNATVNVTDTYAGSLGSFSDTGSKSYPRKFTCPEDVGDHPNTAKIVETGQSSSASVHVDCIAPLEVTKDAATTFTRTWNWTIDKSVDIASWKLADGSTGTSTYTVTVTKTGSTDSDWAVSGSIYIHNPSSIAANITAVSDIVSGPVAANVNCGVSFPYSLAAYGDLKCSYSAWLPDGSSRTNTAEATTDGLVPGGTGTAAVTFGSPSKVVNDTVNVTDTYAGSLGSFSNTGSKSYTRAFTCAKDAGDFPNTAEIVETGAKDSVTVHVECLPTVAYWCSPGFWAQHLDVTDNYVALNTLYSAIGGVALKDGAPPNPTIEEVLAEPNTYGGPAFNSVANYISGIAFAPNGGTQSTGENCPIDAHGDPK